MEDPMTDPRDEALRACVAALEASKTTLDMLTAPRTIKASSAIQAWGHCVETELVVRKALATARAALDAPTVDARADERAACIALVYGHAGSDNDAQRIVDAIKQRGEGNGS
jgi:hypothetical protein